MGSKFFRKLFVCSIMFLAFSLNALLAKAITANVMAPLEIDLTNQSEVSAFESQLATCKSIGVEAVSVDVWWGMVEGTSSGSFDWNYYDSVFKMITNAGLQIQPIMSFHACGGNVGDTVNIPIPGWIWGIAGSGANYVSEQEDPGNPEIISVWAANNAGVLNEYKKFMAAFQAHFANYASNIQSINISCGPAGELRYPSYDSYVVNNVTWGRGYPTRGYLECYSSEAISSFRNAMSQKYGNITVLNTAWGTSLSSFNDINPPSDGDTFFQIANPKAYINAQYGKDFIEWYNNILVSHGKDMLTTADAAFNGAFSSIPLEIKIPGIHWEMSDPGMPRSAEVCAGVLANNFYIWNRPSPAGGTEYLPILNMVKSFDGVSGRHVLIYFTCLEMANGDINNPPYSQPSALVFWVGTQAGNINLSIKGENALAPNGGSTWAPNCFWWNINNAIQYSSYAGINILRIGDVAGDPQQCSNYRQLINNYN